MLLVFQLFFSAFTLYAASGVWMRKKDGLLGSKGTCFWLSFWGAALVMVWWPESTSALAKLVGIGRGADVVLYSSIAVLFFLLFRLHIKIESIGRDMTRITRHVALKQTHKK